jgi:hypothetical protein
MRSWANAADHRASFRFSRQSIATRLPIRSPSISLLAPIVKFDERLPSVPPSSSPSRFFAAPSELPDPKRLSDLLPKGEPYC